MWMMMNVTKQETMFFVGSVRVQCSLFVLFVVFLGTERLKCLYVCKVCAIYVQNYGGSYILIKWWKDECIEDTHTNI